jgi:hypothetical protein
MADPTEYVCAACGKVIESPTPSGATVPYLLTGGILGKEQLYACSNACFVQVVEGVQRRIGGQLRS